MSNRSQQFNESFQRYLISSDDDYLNTPRDSKKSYNTSEERLQTHNMIRSITSNIVNRIIGYRKDKPTSTHITPPTPQIPTMPAPSAPQWWDGTYQSENRHTSDQLEELSEEQEENGEFDNKDDEFDHLIESQSSTKFQKSKYKRGLTSLYEF